MHFLAETISTKNLHRGVPERRQRGGRGSRGEMGTEIWSGVAALGRAETIRICFLKECTRGGPARVDEEGKTDAAFLSGKAQPGAPRTLVVSRGPPTKKEEEKKGGAKKRRSVMKYEAKEVRDEVEGPNQQGWAFSLQR